MIESPALTMQGFFVRKTMPLIMPQLGQFVPIAPADEDGTQLNNFYGQLAVGGGGGHAGAEPGILEIAPGPKKKFIMSPKQKVNPLLPKLEFNVEAKKPVPWKLPTSVEELYAEFSKGVVVEEWGTWMGTLPDPYSEHGWGVIPPTKFKPFHGKLLKVFRLQPSKKYVIYQVVLRENVEGKCLFTIRSSSVDDFANAKDILGGTGILKLQTPINYFVVDKDVVL